MESHSKILGSTLRNVRNSHHPNCSVICESHRYTPGDGQPRYPGFVVTYKFQSDGSSVPEPNVWPLMALGWGVGSGFEGAPSYKSVLRPALQIESSDYLRQSRLSKVIASATAANVLSGWPTIQDLKLRSLPEPTSGTVTHKVSFTTLSSQSARCAFYVQVVSPRCDNY